MAEPVAAFIDVLERVQEVLAVGVILEEGLFLVAARSGMINCSRILDAKGA